MKVSEFNQTMAYLLRPQPRQMLSDGGETFETLSKKERIAQGLEKGRVSRLVDTYTAAINEFDNKIREAFENYDASKFPENIKKFLEKKGLKDTTYYGLKNKLTREWPC